MQIPFKQLARVVKAIGFVPNRNDASEQDIDPDLDHVLISGRLGEEGVWAILTNRFEVLALRLLPQGGASERLVLARADLVAAHRAMSAAGALEDDFVVLQPGQMSLRRAQKGAGRKRVVVKVQTDLVPNIRSLPESSGPSVAVSGEAVSAIQRAVDLWDGAGHRFWLTRDSGAFSSVRGILRRTAVPLNIPCERLGFSDFSGFGGLDPAQDCQCSLGAIPGISEALLPWACFEQADAAYFSLRLAPEEMVRLNPSSAETALDCLLRDPAPWFKVPRRPERRELTRVLTELGWGCVITTGPDGKVLADNGSDAVVPLPMVEASGAGAMTVRCADLCRVLRQDYSVFGLPSDPSLAGVIFSRTDGSEAGVISSAVRPQA